MTPADKEAINEKANKLKSLISSIDSYIEYSYYFIDEEILYEPEEISLYNKLKQSQGQVNDLYKKRDFEEILRVLSGLVPYANDFLDNVRIHHPERKDLQINRMNLLNNIARLMSLCGNLTELQGMPHA